jgi:hypothetical protein
MNKPQSPLVDEMRKSGARASVRELRSEMDLLDTRLIINEHQNFDENDLKTPTNDLTRRQRLASKIPKPRVRWSLLYAVAAGTCFALAFIISRIDTSGANYDPLTESKNNYNQTASVDCLRLQTTGVALQWTEQLLFNGLQDEKGQIGNVSHFEESFLIDIKTPPSMT